VSNSDLQLPLIGYKNIDKSFHFFRDFKHVGLCTYQAFKKGWFSDMTLLSLSGNAYTIEKVWIKKYRLRPLFYWLLLSPIVECTFHLAKAKLPMKFGDFKKKLIKYIQEDSYFENVGITTEIVEAVRKAQSYLDLELVMRLMHNYEESG
jgi:hypothetical protein